MSMLLAILTIACAPQEGPDALVKTLQEGSIEERERAAEQLVRLGEPSRAALEKASTSSDAELRTRATAILKLLDFHKEMRAWLASPSRITLNGQMTLEEAIRGIEAQSGQKVKCDSWPEGRFRVALKDAGYWEALESVCRASGARTLYARPEGAILSGDRHLKTPSFFSGSFGLRFDSLREDRYTYFMGGHQQTTLSVRLDFGWERSVAPAKFALALDEVRDDLGNDLLPGILAYETRVFSGTPMAVIDPGPSFMTNFHSTSQNAADPKASRIAVMKGTVLLWIRASPEDIELQIPPAGAASTAEFTLCDARRGPTEVLSFVLSNVHRQGAHLQARLTVEKIDPRMMKDTFSLWHVKDAEGKRYPGGSMGYFGPDAAKGQVFQLNFVGLPASAAAKTMSIRLPRRAVAMELPFVLKDIPLK